MTIVRNTIRFALIVMVLQLAAQETPKPFPKLSGPYFGQKLPEKTPELLAPEIPQFSRSLHSTPTFSPDGLEVIWPAASQPPYPLMTSRVVNGVWTAPARFAFSMDGITDDSPFISPDGKKLFFLSLRPLTFSAPGARERLWVCERTPTGWSEPRLLPGVVNDMGLHWQFSVDLQGNLCFGSPVRGSSGKAGSIYLARYVGGTYATPQKLPPAINAEEAYNHSPSLAPDGSYLIFTRQVNRTNTSHVSFRRSDGSWTEAKPLADLLKASYASGGRVTSDGKALIFRGPVAKPYWVDAGFIEELRRIELKKT